MDKGEKRGEERSEGEKRGDSRRSEEGLVGWVKWDGIYDLILSPSPVLGILALPERVLRKVDGGQAGMRPVRNDDAATESKMPEGWSEKQRWGWDASNHPSQASWPPTPLTMIPYVHPPDGHSLN